MNGLDINIDILPVDEKLVKQYKKIKDKEIDNYNKSQIAYILGISKSSISYYKINWIQLLKILIDLNISNDVKKEFLYNSGLKHETCRNIWKQRDGDW